MATTKAPTTLQLARKKDKLTCSWKIKDKDYKDGQQFQYAFVESRKIGTTYRRVQQWSDVKSLNVKETSKAVTVSTGNYYPNTSVYLKGFTFEVRGNRDSYTKKHKTINPGWSEWAVKTFEFSELPKPVMGTPELANEIRCQFPWAMPNAVTHESVKYYYTDLEWESALTRKGAAPTWDIKTGTKSTIVSGSYKTGTFKTFSGTISIEESGTDHLFTGDYSYTRWVRARARGPEGPSAWVTKSHVYTEPSVSKDITATLTKVSNGYRCVARWTSDTNKAKKIDETQVQYCFTIPTADMGCPDGASWENVRNPLPDTQGQNAIQFVLSNPPGQDEVMFVKINNTYDAKEQPGVPILVNGSIQKLKAPTLTAVTPNVETSMVQVTATNNSEVPGSFLAVYYRAGEETGDGQFVGVMSNQTQSIKVPKWGENGFALGIKAYAAATYSQGSNTEHKLETENQSIVLTSDEHSKHFTLKNVPLNKTTVSLKYHYEQNGKIASPTYDVIFSGGSSTKIGDSDDPYNNLDVTFNGTGSFSVEKSDPDHKFDIVIEFVRYTYNEVTTTDYAIRPNNSEFGYMESDFVWNDGDIPLPPANVKVRQVGNAEDGNATLYVEWEWNWKQANQVELSWADHEDAWESTDEPQTYVIENYKPNHWKIANLAVGKWWVKLRFIKVTDDATVYGTYADAVTDTGEKYINLATSPAIPKLLLQPEVITEDGTTTASWAYQSNDGSEQAFAEIWEKLDDGTYRVFDPEINTQTQQFINISAPRQGWKTGETHNLALKVTSEKGEESPEFSEAVSVTIADKPVVNITDTSLETRSVEVNPKTHSGNPITFTNPEGTLEFAKLRVDLEPTQDGTGDPSPSNVRPIHGVGSVEVSDVGTNQWDEEWEMGGIGSSNGVPYSTPNAIRSKNFSACLPNETYYFKGAFAVYWYNSSQGFISADYVGNNTKVSPASARYFKIGCYDAYGTTYKNDISINYPSTDHDYHAYQEPIEITQALTTTLQPIASDDEPYLMRAMPYDDATNLTENLVGGTVAWNQYVQRLRGGVTVNGVTITPNADMTLTVNGTATGNVATPIIDGVFPADIKSHRFLVTESTKVTGGGTNWFFYNGYAQNGRAYEDKGGGIVTHNGTADWTSALYMYIGNGITVNNVKLKINVFDLTAMFGTTIADYIYSLEQTTAGAGVAWFKKLFPKSYYPYDAGSLQSVKALSHVTTGFNQWDEETTITNNRLRSKTYIKVSSNMAYYFQCPNGTYADIGEYSEQSIDSLIQYQYKGGSLTTANNVFTTSTNTSYILFTMNAAYGTTYKSDICINISDPDKNGTYEPYDGHTYSLPNVELRGILKWVNGKLSYDGDILEPSGRLTRKYGIVDLGTLTWAASGEYLYAMTRSNPSIGNIKPAPYSSIANMVCPRYQVMARNNLLDKYMSMHESDTGCLTIRDSNYNGNASGFKSAMSGVYLVYELATATTETVSSFESNQLVSAGGTESYTDTRTVPIPVGHKSTYKTSHVYGGYVDLVSGELVVDRAVVDLGSLGWSTGIDSRHTVFYARFYGLKYVTDNVVVNAISSQYKAITKVAWSGVDIDTDNVFRSDNATDILYFRNLSYTDSTAFKTAMNGVTLCYELATPIRTTLTSRELSALVGRNTLTANGNMQIRLAEGITETECLTRLPLTVSISGGEGNSSTLSILRLGNSPTYRPDDSEKDGFDGEVIATADSTDGSFIFEKPDIKGYLDEEGMYVLRASTTDSLGQSAVSEDKPFRVLWDHQAVYPSADVTVDVNSLSAQITPTVSAEDVPDGWSIDPDDGFDIYRLSSDKPELIYRGAKSGQTIVDPYPAFGDQGGHRIVFVTKYGDYTTADNVQAIYDTDEDDGDILNVFNVTIDFAGERVVLPYDISVSHKWSKDFTETKYLGGSVRGDWNPAVSKTTSINTTVIVEEDPEQIRLMRDLAVYPGLCHVRTPDGCSFTADVEVNEDREEKWVNRLAKFSLSITRVDNDGFDGMTYDEWIS